MNWRKRLELALIEFMMDETSERLIPFRQSLRRLCGARRSPKRAQSIRILLYGEVFLFDCLIVLPFFLASESPVPCPCFAGRK